MTMFSNWDDDESNDNGWLFRDDNDEYTHGHPNSAYKDDGDMKMFKDDDSIYENIDKG
jgi:hypothetical protein